MATDTLWNRKALSFSSTDWAEIIIIITLGHINESASSFLYDLGRRISLVSGEDREPQFLFQCISVRDAIYNGTGNSAHYRLAYADFRSGAWTVAPCGGE